MSGIRAECDGARVRTGPKPNLEVRSLNLEVNIRLSGGPMASSLAVTFTGLQFENPFLLSSAPPTESESNILRAFDAGWGGVVTKTIGLHPVVNVAGPKTKFQIGRAHV